MEDATAYLVGFCVLSLPEGNIDKENKKVTHHEMSKGEREKLVGFCKYVDRNEKSIATVGMRWVMTRIETASCGQIFDELVRKWMAVPPSDKTIMMFLRGYFDTTDGGTTITRHQATIIMSELDRVAVGLPVRYQQLYFELGRFCAMPAPPTLDVAPMVEALRYHRFNFPALLEEQGAPPEAPLVRCCSLVLSPLLPGCSLPPTPISNSG